MSGSYSRAKGKPFGYVCFLAWVVVGIGISLGFVLFGLMVFVPSVVLAGLMLWPSDIRRWAFGLPSGVGVLLFFIAYVNREGPFSPLPWLGLGALFLVLGIVGQARLAAHTSSD
jgi:hypothetical protein